MTQKLKRRRFCKAGSTKDVERCVWVLIMNGQAWWTKEGAGKFACRTCANKNLLCIRYDPKADKHVVLPLPADAAEDDFGVDMFVAKEPNISRRVKLWATV